jgi:hypothetical protein
MSKYIPKVGDTVLSDTGKKCKVLHIGEKSLFVKGPSSEFCAAFKFFQPIPTKADIEREKLDEILSECYVYGTESKVNAIQQAGFTIPKKVKRIDIYNTFRDSIESLHFISADTATDEMVNLLGDLIQD